MSVKQKTEPHNNEDASVPVRTGAALRQWVLAQFAASADETYKTFHEKLIPGIQTEFGVRIPEIRKLAKVVLKENPTGFLNACKNESYEEAQLCGLVIAGMQLDFPEKLSLVTAFLPRIDNWAICDTFCAALRMKKTEKAQMRQYILPLFSHSQTYFVRFAVVMLLFHFTDDIHITENLLLLKQVSHPDYYVKMAVAWAISLCYIKFPAETMPLLTAKKLDKFTQNKSIQKIRESCRVGQAEKDALLGLKI